MRNLEMNEDEILDSIIDFSKKVFAFWKDSYGWAPKNVVDMLINVKFDWLLSLTKTLDIWIEKGICMSEGELLLARANLGSLVEGWLKLFYCVYYNDYTEDEDKKVNKSGREVKPNKLDFEYLKKFSVGKLYKEDDEWYRWINKVQHMRNAIHSFNYRDIGTSVEFLNDIKIYFNFIITINNSLPYPDTMYF